VCAGNLRGQRCSGGGLLRLPARRHRAGRAETRPSSEAPRRGERHSAAPTAPPHFGGQRSGRSCPTTAARLLDRQRWWSLNQCRRGSRMRGALRQTLQEATWFGRQAVRGPTGPASRPNTEACRHQPGAQSPARVLRRLASKGADSPRRRGRPLAEAQRSHRDSIPFGPCSTGGAADRQHPVRNLQRSEAPPLGLFKLRQRPAGTQRRRCEGLDGCSSLVSRPRQLSGNQRQTSSAAAAWPSL